MGLLLFDEVFLVLKMLSIISAIIVKLIGDTMNNQQLVLIQLKPIFYNLYMKVRVLILSLYCFICVLTKYLRC
jgi:hypothetical protein